MAKSITGSLLVWFIEFIVVAAMISESWSYKVMEMEKKMAAEFLGPEAAEQILQETDTVYDKLFVKTGVVATVYKYFIPTEETRRRSGSLADLGRDNVFPIIEERLNVIWSSVYQVVYRLTAFSVWLPYLGLFFIPALIDGLIVRQIKKTNFDYASPLMHRSALYIIIMTMYLLILALFAPIPLPPWIIPIAGAVVAMSMGLLAANTQKRI